MGLHNGQHIDHNCKHTTLDIRMLNNAFSCIVKHSIIISNTPLCYGKYHTISNYAFEKVNYDGHELHSHYALVYSVTCIIPSAKCVIHSATYLIVRSMLGYSNGQQNDQ